MGFEFRILGPLEVLHDGAAVAVGGRKKRILLALLAVDAGRPVAPDRLIEAIWPDYDPAAPARLQVYVSQLRRALGDPAAIALRSGGYALGPGADAVDATRFERLAADGREALAAGELERAAHALRDAIALWRGPALGELAYEPFAQATAGRLEELRTRALEDRVAADLALGLHRELLGELEALVAAQPLSERLRAAQMLALYRSGEQARALDAFLAARRTLIDELGVEPGPELRELHAAILRQDPGLAVEPAAVRSRRHLPAPTASLVGRGAQLGDLVELLGDDDVRLVTLTGPGGTGKTRLALATAAALAERFDHGVWFAGLAAEEDPARVPDAIAGALRVDERADRPVLETLEEHLRDRRLLLVVDNFEHVDAAAPVVSRLLAAAPGLKVLATSRARLRLYGEHEYAVPPLAAPEAVDLFVVRARAARRGFAPDSHGAAAIAEICARLDGLPLAIELAAARTASHSPEELLAGIARRLELAVEGPRDAPERQRTLRAALDWSHRLLTDAERDAFARLGVFVGGWTDGAAAEVASAAPAQLASLVEQSLLERRGSRSSMLETVREYALERLAETGDEERVRALHAAHFAALADAAEGELTADPHDTWVHRLEEEHANLRAALAWCERSGELELELGLVGALARFWAVRGHLREGRAWLDGALERSVGRVPALRAKALAGAASLALRQGDYDSLNAFAGEAVALCESLGDRRGLAQALDRLATAAANTGDEARGLVLYERSVSIFREIGDERGLAVTTTNLGCLAMMQGHYERAGAMSREGLALHRRMGQRDGMLQPQFNLGVIELLQGNGDAAAELFCEGLVLALELGFVEGLVYFLEGLAAVEAARGDGERAAGLLGAAEAAAERTGVVLEPFERRELHDRTVELVRTALGEPRMAAAAAAGRELGAEAVAASIVSEAGGGESRLGRPSPQAST